MYNTVVDYTQLCCALDLQDSSSGCKFESSSISSITPTPPSPGKHRSTVCFCKFGFFIFHNLLILYSTPLSLSDLSHLAYCPQGPSMLLQMKGFSSFPWLNDIALYMKNIFMLCVCIHVYTHSSFFYPFIH